ncbi:MAG: hypothetical protein EOP04_00480 [Proteobacteria bacterium]|nr:MAG: hypothetical protein EOP04_00480 [Pseudomonadota bacterium]
MEQPETLEQLFAPLNQRLNFFESKGYYVYHFEDYWIGPTVHSGIIDTIGDYIYSYNPQEALDLIEFQSARAERARLDLELPRTGVEYNGVTVIEVPFSDKEKLAIYNHYKEELLLYQQRLQHFKLLLQKKLGLQSTVPKPLKEDVKRIFILEGEIKVKELTGHGFKQRLSPTEVAVFLHLLSELEAIPKYDQTSQARIGQILFGRPSRDVSGGVREVLSSPHKKELGSLRKLLEELVSEFDLYVKRTK